MPLDDQKELFVVVDENDKIVGYRTRYECHHDNRLIHRGIGVIVFNAKGEILLQKRSKYKDLFPGFYSISAGGHVSKGETYLEAAQRELYEEIGIKTSLKFRKKFLFKIKIETEMDVLYSSIYNGSFNLDTSEVERVEFFQPKEIKKIINKLSPYAVESLKQLRIL